MMDTLTALLSAPVGGRELIASSKRQRWLKIAFILLLGGMTALHYLTSAHFLPYHTIYRSLYFLPIAIAVAVWGLRGLSAATRAFIITLREEGRGFVQ